MSCVDKVRVSLEAIIVASCVDNDDFLIDVKAKNVSCDDFGNDVCRDVFSILEKLLGDGVRATDLVIEQEYKSLLYQGPVTENEVQGKLKIFKLLLQRKEVDESALLVHLDNFMKYKVKDNVVGILKNALSMAEDGDAESVLNFVLDGYVKSFNTGREVNGINFYDLMRRDIEKYNPYVEQTREQVDLVKTGIYAIDNNYLNGGTAKGTMCIVAGRPGSGKTTLVKVIGKNVSQQGKNVLFISLEMSDEQIAQGYYAQIARVEYGKILKNQLNAEEYSRMVEAVNKEENKLKNFHIYENDSLTISQLVNILIRYKKKHGIEVILLDYIQLVRLDNGSMPKNEQEYSIISELVRTIIKQLDLYGFICAQVNRDCEKRPDKQPVASDLRSSGKLEMDAAYILTTYRDEIYNKDTDHPKTMDIAIAKNRFGPAGKVRVMFEGEYQNIQNLIDGDLGD